MPQTPHTVKHFTSTEVVRDVVIGLSDGLTVPLALAAGSIAMGLGGHPAARGDAEHYASERQQREFETLPDVEASEVAAVFPTYGLTTAQSAPIVAALQQKPDACVDFMWIS